MNINAQWETVMKTTFVTALLTACYLMAVLAVTMITFAGIAHAAVPPGADAINGAYERMFHHEPTGLASPAPADATVRLSFEQMINAAMRGERNALERVVDAPVEARQPMTSGRSAY